MKRQKRIEHSRRRRRMRVRKKARGDASRPRLSVFRSNRHIYAQLIDDEQGRTLCSASSRTLCGAYGGRTEHASTVGSALADQARKLAITRVRFDRGPYRFHGRVRALAEAAREKGLEF